jgi:hypothetical protein
MPKKLTDTQLVLLSTAAQHPDSAIDLAGYPKGAVAKKAITRLLEDRLVEEILADGTLPVWRRDHPFREDRGGWCSNSRCAIPKDECRSQGSPEPPRGCPSQVEQRRLGNSRQSPARVFSNQSRVIEMLQRQPIAAIV